MKIKERGCRKKGQCGKDCEKDNANETNQGTFKKLRTATTNDNSNKNRERHTKPAVQRRKRKRQTRIKNKNKLKVSNEKMVG